MSPLHGSSSFLSWKKKKGLPFVDPKTPFLVWCGSSSYWWSDRLLTPLAHPHPNANEIIETGPITPLHSSTQPDWIKMAEAWTLRDAHNLNKTFDYIALWLKKTIWYIELHPWLADLNIEILSWIIGQSLMRAEGFQDRVNFIWCIYPTPSSWASYMESVNTWK